MAVVPLATIRRRSGICGAQDALCVTTLGEELNHSNSGERKNPSPDRVGGRAAEYFRLNADAEASSWLRQVLPSWFFLSFPWLCIRSQRARGWLPWRCRRRGCRRG